MDKLSPNTTLALLQSTQTDASKAAAQAKNSKDGSINVEKAEAAAQEFEAVFIAEMMKPMFEGITAEAPFNGGKGEEVFQSMLLQEYGKLISQTGSIGMAKDVKDTMIRMQQEADGIDPLAELDAEKEETSFSKSTPLESSFETIALTNGEQNATSIE